MKYVSLRSQGRGGAIVVNVLLEHLVALYGEDKGRATLRRLKTILKSQPPHVDGP